jgi:N-acetylmuramic acid 6-phosphate (MurNAc-6-P) etherase
MTNTKPQIKIVNCETGEEIVRDATVEEITQIEAEQAAQAIAKAEAQVKETAKAALLNKLGITAEEAQLLLGGN